MTIKNKNGTGLPSLNYYSKVQIDQASALSPALASHLPRVLDQDIYSRRHKAWCESYLATVFNTAATAVICFHWSKTAEGILCEIAEQIFTRQNIALFTFGKLGSNELNLSSDVDLLFVCRESSEEIIQKVRSFQKLLSENTEKGFLYRVDYELRPGGKLAPLVPSLEQVIDYYGNYGETWERMAFIRLRPIWGDDSIIKEISEFRKKFSFRKHLDFGLLEDLNTLRNKIHAFAKTRERPGEIDLKLELGGIRDIELFCHALQVIHGGRNSGLHTANTTKAFELLAEQKILPDTDCKFLNNFYWKLRHLENMVQGKEDAQTHHMPESLLSPSGVAELRQKMEQTSQLVAGLLGSIKPHAQRIPVEISDQKIWLRAKGFLAQEIEAHWTELKSLPVLSRHKEKDSEQRDQFLTAVLTKMGTRSQTPHRLVYLKEFLHATRAKSSFYSLLIKNESLTEILAEIFCSSALLSRMLCSRPEILDSLIMRNVDAVSIDSEWDDFLQALVDMKQITEFIAGADFLRTLNLEKLMESLSRLADDIVLRLWKKIQIENSASDISIWALGKWGGQELGMFSDLDCIFVTDGEPTENDLRALRRFINRLTESHRGGSLYSIDTRLRTSDQTGILLTSEENLKKHLEAGLHPWERQAYLKVREVGQLIDSQNIFKSKLTEVPFSTEELLELNRIRHELTKKSKSQLDLKYQEGGLVDTELGVQAAFIQNGLSTAEASIVSMVNTLVTVHNDWKDRATALLKNYRFMRVVEQTHRLISDEAEPILDPSQDSFSRTASHFHLNGTELLNQLRSALKEQVNILNFLDPRRQQK